MWTFVTSLKHGKHGTLLVAQKFLTVLEARVIVVLIFGAFSTILETQEFISPCLTHRRLSHCAWSAKGVFFTVLEAREIVPLIFGAFFTMPDWQEFSLRAWSTWESLSALDVQWECFSSCLKHGWLLRWSLDHFPSCFKHGSFPTVLEARELGWVGLDWVVALIFGSFPTVL